LFVIVATHIFHDQIKSSKIKEEMQWQVKKAGERGTILWNDLCVVD
jgi:hypothetical protein